MATDLGGSEDGTTETAVSLFWIPLGAGGNGYVRLNGRLYEALVARRERRPRLDLFHTALTVQVPEGLFVIENAWPSPDADTDARGVVFEGPVFGHLISRFRPFRYEVRCWRNGVIADVRQAIDSPQRLSDDPAVAKDVLRLVTSVPRLLWGRDERRTGEMWNSNSVISWLLTRGGFSMEDIHPPTGGRAPGWHAGTTVARG